MSEDKKGPLKDTTLENKEKPPYFYFDIAEESSKALEDEILKDGEDDPLSKLGKTTMYEW